MGDGHKEIVNEISANNDLTLVETSSGLRGGTELVRFLQSESDRDHIQWRYEFVSQYLTYVSARLGVKIEVIEQPVIV